MTESLNTTEAAQLIHRTAVFFTDPRASLLFLTETLEALITQNEIGHALVDLSTLPGLTIAGVFHRSNWRVGRISRIRWLPTSATVVTYSRPRCRPRFTNEVSSNPIAVVSVTRFVSASRRASP